MKGWRGARFRRAVLVTQSAVSTVTGATEQQERFGKKGGHRRSGALGVKGMRNWTLRTAVGDTVAFISIHHTQSGKPRRPTSTGRGSHADSTPTFSPAAAARPPLPLL